MEIKKEHELLRKQLSIMKEDLVVSSSKSLVEQKIISKEDMNDILASLLRVEFRFDIPKLPPEGMMNFDNINVK